MPPTDRPSIHSPYRPGESLEARPTRLQIESGHAQVTFNQQLTIPAGQN
jgi:hypothetical protein